jgi:hypothetical protein
LEYFIIILDILWPFSTVCVHLVHLLQFWCYVPGKIWWLLWWLHRNVGWLAAKVPRLGDWDPPLFSYKMFDKVATYVLTSFGLHTKFPNFGIFWRALECTYNVGTFYDHLSCQEKSGILDLPS